MTAPGPRGPWPVIAHDSAGTPRPIELFVVRTPRGTEVQMLVGRECKVNLGKSERAKLIAALQQADLAVSNADWAETQEERRRSQERRHGRDRRQP